MENNDLQLIQAARNKLWIKGNLIWKLDATQRTMYKFYKNCNNKIVIWNSSRRIGKSFALICIALEECIKKPNVVVKYITPEQKMAKTIVRPLLKQIIEDAPLEVKPEYKTNDSIYVFPNGSEIQLAGTDNGNHEKLRGGSSTLCIVDEAGFCNELSYVVRSVLIPTTMTTGGKVLLSSTPPRSPDHDFKMFMEEAEIKGALVTKTIYDAVEDSKNDPNPRITLEMVETYKAQYPGGEKNTEFQREYLCRVVTESQNAIVPEFSPEVEKDIVTVWPRPKFYDAYVSMDIGFRDLTVALFGYYDFLNGVFVFEDEVVMNGVDMTTDKLAEEIRKKEIELWSNPITLEKQEPYLRISDNNLIVINDLARLHNIRFMPTQKDDMQAAINNLRMKIGSRKIYINPKCKTLITHLRNGIWDKNKLTFGRGADKSHYDAIASAMYMIRNVNYTKNPYPPGYNINLSGGELFYSPNYYNKLKPNDQWTKLINPMKNKRFNK